MAATGFTSLILSKYYPYVTDLKEYLSIILQCSVGDASTDDARPLPFLPTANDTPAYHDLINTTRVSLKDSQKMDNNKHRFKAFQVVSDMREVIERAHERLFKTKSPINIITMGYRLARNQREFGKKGATDISVINEFTNTIVSALQTPEWESLLYRIGLDAMLHLLTETSLFLALPNGCLCQIVGEPIITLFPRNPNMSKNDQSLLSTKRSLPHPQDESNDRPLKKQRIEKSTNDKRLDRDARKNSPVDVLIVRSKMFFARPNFSPRTKRIIVGLPLKHILNCIYPSYDPKVKIDPAEYVEPDYREQEKNTRHVSKYIFPKQYHLSSPSLSTKPSDYLDRDSEIKAAGPCKTPKRLKEILPLVDKLIWRHKKCGYKPLRDKVCPSKIHSTGNKDLDDSIILELLSEQSIHLRSQVSIETANLSVDSSKRSIFSDGLSQAERYAKEKPRFVEFSCSFSEVYCYVKLITIAVIPKSFWGCKRNLQLILKHVKKFIECRRFETLSLHHILQGFSTSACDWLIPPGPGARMQTRVSVSDSLKRRELLEEFVFWYFDSFVVPLVKTAFYVTESSAFRNRVLYFRQDDWAVLCAPLIQNLTCGTFQKLSDSEATEVLRQRKLGFSFVRLLPKENGVRPIVNLRRKAPSHMGYEQSINQILQAAFQVLNYERKVRPELLGASVFGPDDVFAKLKKFKAYLPLNQDGSLPKLYFVKMDVQACFDTIEQSKLITILHTLISEDKYMVQRYSKVSMSGERIKRMFIKNARPADDHIHFLTYVTELANVLRNTIFVDLVKYTFSDKQKILNLLQEHITENIVKIGNHYYRQTVGIPQGSVLSTLLCSFFYGDLEKRFGRFTDDNQSTLLRLIDDYLYITTSPSKARKFLDVMNRGHPEYGCFVSREKTVTNFYYDSEVLNILEPDSDQCFPWCGYAINMVDLSISVDYSRYFMSGVRNTLTVDRGKNPGAAFSFKLMHLVRAKSHAIYTDRDLNTEYTVYLNIYQNFLIAAIKTHGYLKDLGSTCRVNMLFISRCIQRAIECCYSSIHAQTRRKLRDISKPKSVQKWAVIWLGNHAFHSMLKTKPTNYRLILAILDAELKRPRYRRYQRRFRKLVKESQETLSHIIT